MPGQLRAFRRKLPVGERRARIVDGGDMFLCAFSKFHIVFPQDFLALCKGAEIDDVVHIQHDVERILQICDQPHMPHAVPRGGLPVGKRRGLFRLLQSSASVNAAVYFS